MTTALLLIAVNALAFEGGDDLLRPAQRPEANCRALEQMERLLGADIRPSSALVLDGSTIGSGAPRGGPPCSTT